MKCKNFVIHSDDSDFFETESIGTTDYSVEKDALWCLNIFITKEHSMNNFDLIKSCMDVIEMESFNKELNSITYYYSLRDYGSLMNEIYWIENKYNVEIVTYNEMNSIIPDLDFFDTIYKKAVNFLNCKKWQKFPELVQELFY